MKAHQIRRDDVIWSELHNDWIKVTDVFLIDGFVKVMVEGSSQVFGFPPNKEVKTQDTPIIVRIVG